MMMVSSDLSLALTSESQIDEDYQFVGRRKKTPLTSIRLPRYRAHDYHRVEVGSRRPPRGRGMMGGGSHRRFLSYDGGDLARRNVHRNAPSLPFTFHLNRPPESSDSPLARPDTPGSPPLCFLGQQPPRSIRIIRSWSDSNGETEAKRSPAPPRIVGRPKQKQPPKHKHSHMQNSGQASLLPVPRQVPTSQEPQISLGRGQSLYTSILPPSRRHFVTSAATVGSNHAQAVLALGRLRCDIESELSAETLSEDLAVLRKFEVDHPVQMHLWIQAFTKWDTFLRSLFPHDLQRAVSMPLTPSDGEMLLSVMPCSTTIAYIQHNVRAAAPVLAHLKLTKLMQQLLTIQGIAEKSVSLTVCLLILEATACAQNYCHIVRQSLRILRSKPCFKRLFELSRELSSELVEKSDTDGDACTSVWSLIMLISEPAHCVKLAQALKVENLTAELHADPFDELMDLVDQADIESALQDIKVYIMTCHGSLSQSIALIRAVTRRIKKHCAQDAPLPETTTAEPSSASTTKRSFNESSVQSKIHKLYIEVDALHAALTSEMNETLAGELRIWESSTQHPGVSLPTGTLLKSLVLFIETVRNCIVK